MASDDTKPTNCKLHKGRWYWEPPARLKAALNLKSRPLGADQHQAWSLARRLNHELAGITLGGTHPGTIAWVFDRFFEYEKFLTLAASTQTDYRWLARRIGKVQMGNRPLAEFLAASIRPRHADFIIADIEKASGHATAHYCARFCRRVWEWAARKEYVQGPINPWAKMELRGLPERDQRWQPDQVAAIIAQAEEQKFFSIANAVRIAYSFAHRKSDILPLTWTVWDSGFRKTSKTGITLPADPTAYPDLHAAIEAERARQKASKIPSTHVLPCELTNRPWHPDVFSHHFRQIANAAGIPAELQFRDLRATAATELSDAGATIIDLSTHTGHKDMKMARRYSRRTQDQFQRAAALRQANKPKDEAPAAQSAQEEKKNA